MSDGDGDVAALEGATTVLTGDASAVASPNESSDAAAAATGDASTDTGTGNADTGNGEGEGKADGGNTPPDTYADFAMPEGIEVDAAVLEEALPVFKELGLTQDAAQKLVDFQAARVQAEGQKQVDAFTQLKQDWHDQSVNDSEFGGDAFAENVALAQAALNNFGTPELKQLMEDYGVGNHPEMLRFMIKVGKLTAEDVPGSSGSNVAAGKDVVSAMYPNDRNK